MEGSSHGSAAPRRRGWVLGVSLALFILVTASLLAAAAVIFSTLDAVRRERALVETTDQVIAAIGEIGRSAINAETGQRGYFITLDEAYLASYELGRETYPAALRRLRSLLAGRSDRRTTELLNRVEQLTQERFAELARSVDLAAEGRIIDAEQAILSDEGQDLMEELRATLAELERGERARLAAARQDTAELEARIVPLLLILLAVVCGALALGLWQIGRAAHAEAQAAQAGALAEARDRADLLARELNHRVKNLLSVVLGIVRMTGRGSPEARPVIERISQRLHALLRAHEVTQGAGHHATVNLGELIASVIAPYSSDEQKCTLEGKPVVLPGRMAVPLGLVLHELVTNAVKYGAWSGDAGLIEVRWRIAGERLLIDWREHGPELTGPPTSRGFGSQLIDSSARQLDGSIERSYRADGIDVRMDLPLVAASEEDPSA